jgi:hypothetical protein
MPLPLSRNVERGTFLFCTEYDIYSRSEGVVRILYKLNRRGLPPCNDEAMDLTKMLTELRAERESIEQAILVLERLARGGTRRGRPPEWMRRLEAAEPKPEKRRGRPPGTKNKPKTEVE